MKKATIRYWLQFLSNGIWRITEDEVTPVQRRLYACIKIIIPSVRQFLNDRVLVRASALTYSTLLSIIPILALLFAIARGFGFDSFVETMFRSNVTEEQRPSWSFRGLTRILNTRKAASLSV